MRTISVAVLLVAVGIAWVAAAQPAPVPLIHMTDLYHPHCDPDDHWDLATVYALAARQRVRLLGVVVDYPLRRDQGGALPPEVGDPAIQAIAQMNHITSQAVPMVVGSSRNFSQVPGEDGPLAGADRAGVDFLLNTLRTSPEPVAISVVGSCRDIALAGREAPELFREKCRAIYLNAGTGTVDSAKGANKEWNVVLDPAAYAQVFAIPCPVYWLPCFEDMTWAGKGQPFVARHGSYWRFKQGDVLPHLSREAQNFFLYPLSRGTNPKWMACLDAEVDAAALATHGGFDRNMWCTAGFLHLAGLTVKPSGELAEAGAVAAEEVAFRFQPVVLETSAEGVAQWERGDGPNKRFIIDVQDTAHYAERMTAALRALLSAL